MMNHPSAKNVAAEKPYPRRCAQCGEVAIHHAMIEYDAKIKHDGKLHEYHIDKLPVDRCSACDEVFFTNVTADAKLRALRQYLGLLQPEEVRGLLN